jgi:hypothetical protein
MNTVMPLRMGATASAGPTARLDQVLAIRHLDTAGSHGGRSSFDLGVRESQRELLAFISP